MVEIPQFLRTKKTSYFYEETVSFEQYKLCNLFVVCTVIPE